MFGRPRRRPLPPEDLKITIELREQPDIDLYVKALISMAKAEPGRASHIRTRLAVVQARQAHRRPR
jgi:hypothetical protein